MNTERYSLLMVITSVLLLITIIIFENTNIDLVIQDNFYDFNTKLWILDKHEPISKFIFYDGIKKLYIFFVIGLIVALSFFREKPIIKLYKNGLLIVLISCISIPVFIGFLKATTNVPCADDIQRYGGNYPYVKAFSNYPPEFHQEKNIKCYPAGHASGGFALMSLFFLFTSKRNKNVALLSSILIGWTIGNYKMIIGEHFFSHTLVTMLTSWLLILIVSNIVYKRSKKLIYFQQ